MSRIGNGVYVEGIAMLIKSKSVVGGILGSTLLLVGTTAFADGTPVQREARSTTVQFGDLSLDRAGDVATLLHRITLAADSVCASRAFTGLYYTLSDYRSCVADAVREAVGTTHRAALSAYYLQQTQPRSIRVAEK